MIKKTMTCKQLGGACDLTFEGETFEEIAAKSKEHAIIMFQQNDEPHLLAMKKMQSLMQSPSAMTDWMESKRIEFEAS